MLTETSLALTRGRTTPPLIVLYLKFHLSLSLSCTILVLEMFPMILMEALRNWTVKLGFVWCSQSLLTRHVYTRHSSLSCSSAFTHSHIFVFISSVFPSTPYPNLCFFILLTPTSSSAVFEGLPRFCYIALFIITVTFAVKSPDKTWRNKHWN